MKTKLAGKNLLFLELIIVILFFSIAVTACVTLFGQAHRDSNDSRDLTNAVIWAQSIAEAFKATGCINEAADIIGIEDSDDLTRDGLELYAETRGRGSVVEIYISIRNSRNETIYELIAAIPRERYIEPKVEEVFHD